MQMIINESVSYISTWRDRWQMANDFDSDINRLNKDSIG